MVRLAVGMRAARLALPVGGSPRPGLSELVADGQVNAARSRWKPSAICARAMNWSHGRQGADEDAPNRVSEKHVEPASFAQDLTASQRKSLVRFFSAARKGRDTPAEEAFRAMSSLRRR